MLVPVQFCRGGFKASQSLNFHCFALPSSGHEELIPNRTSFYLPLGMPIKKDCQEKISEPKNHWIIDSVLLHLEPWKAMALYSGF